MQTHAVFAPVRVCVRETDVSGGSWWPHTHTHTHAHAHAHTHTHCAQQGSFSLSFMSLREVTLFEWLPFSAALVCVWCVRVLYNLLSAVSLSRHSFICLWGAQYQATAGPPDWLNITAKLRYTFSFSEEIVVGCQAVARVLLVSFQQRWVEYPKTVLKKK